MDLAEEGGTARLDGLDLLELDGCPAETGGELGGVEVHAGGCGYGAQGRAGSSTDAVGFRVANALLEGTVLLGMVAVGAEGGVAGGRVGDEGRGELAVGGGWVRLGSVVDGGCGMADLVSIHGTDGREELAN
jgi:hypothetical protein